MSIRKILKTWRRHPKLPSHLQLVNFLKQILFWYPMIDIYVYCYHKFASPKWWSYFSPFNTTDDLLTIRRMRMISYLLFTPTAAMEALLGLPRSTYTYEEWNQLDYLCTLQYGNYLASGTCSEGYRDAWKYQKPQHTRYSLRHQT